ncbi:protein DMP7-like [Andrographis paniculata]|uniref:protein DMP7-like n=1 Tax=Andrographis paniculata TaxID=175694 RepID=UPI0021E8D47A|nr:protein DMP7-like [Andrographis paniculata]
MDAGDKPEDHSIIRLPFLSATHQLAGKPPKTAAQKAVRKAFKGTANLANLLPTGTLFVFHFLSPILTHDGKCTSGATRDLAAAFLASCAVSCFVLCFTDSFRDDNGKVRYGIATFRGLLVIDGSGAAVPSDEAEKFRIRFVDFFHALISVVVFAAVAISDDNVIGCFYPKPSPAVVEFVAAVPVAVGSVCSALFVLFPSRRHGIGFPISRR